MGRAWVQLQRVLSVSIAFYFACVLTLPSIASASTISKPVQLTIPETRIEATGYAAPNALVQVFSGSNLKASVLADSNGYFSSNFVSSPGVKTISAQFDDQESVTSQRVSRQLSVTPQQTTSIDFLLPPTLSRRSAATISTGDVVLSGYSLPNAPVTLELSPLQTRSTTSSINGYFEFRLAAASLNPGAYTAKVKVAQGGLESNYSKQQSFTIAADASAEQPDFTPSPSVVLPPPTPESPEDGSTIDGDSVVVSGRSLPNAQIIIYEDGEEYGSIIADADGEWSFVYMARYSPVTLTFEACIDGECSVLSRSLSLSFTRINSACNEQLFTLSQYRFWEVSVGEPVPIDVLQTSGDGVATIQWGDDSIDERFDHDATRPRTYQHRYLEEGSYNGSVRFVQGDCNLTRYFSVSVVRGPGSDVPWERAYLLLLLLPFSIVTYRRGKQLMEQENSQQTAVK